MDTEERQHCGYVLNGKHHAGQWQVHLYGDDRVSPLPRDLTAVRDVDKERAFAKAEQRIDDFLDYWRSRIGDDDSPTLRARRS